MEAAAAWAAVAIAVWIATAQTRERRQQVRREAIAELEVRSTEFGIAAGAMLSGIMRYLNGASDGAELNGPLLLGLSTSTANLNRALRVTQMVCPHQQIHEEIAGIQATLRQFIGLIGSRERVDADVMRTILQRALDEGEVVLTRFVDQSAAAVYVGMKRYSIRPWIPKRLLARAVTIEGRDPA